VRAPISPLLFGLTAGYVHWHNSADSGRVFVLPFTDVLFPASAADPARLGQLSVWLLVGLSGLSALHWLYLVAADRRAQNMHDGGQ